MRRVILRLAFLLPVSGYAQTPAQLAHLAWPLATPSVVSAAPAAESAAAGAGSARDLARLANAGSIVSRSLVRSSPLVASSAMTGGDLARLRGDTVLPAISADVPFYRAASADRPRAE